MRIGARKGKTNTSVATKIFPKELYLVSFVKKNAEEEKAFAYRTCSEKCAAYKKFSTRIHT